MTTEHERIVMCVTSNDKGELARLERVMEDSGIEVQEVGICSTGFRIECHEIELPKLVREEEPFYRRFRGKKKKGGFKKYT